MHARGLKSGANTQLRFVDRVGQKVDRQILGDTQSTRTFDGLDTAGLVKAVTIVIVNLRQHRGRTLALRPTHQRLVCINGALIQIHDGLIGIFKTKIQPRSLAAVLAIASGAFQRRKADGKRGVGSGDGGSVLAHASRINGMC